MNAMLREHAAPEVGNTPAAFEAEQSVIGGLMLAPQALSKIGDWLTEHDFTVPDHRVIYRAVCALIAKNQPCDPVTMMDWLENDGIVLERGNVYPVDLANTTPSAANIVAYAEIVVEKSRLRQALDVAAKVTGAAMRRGADSGQVIATAMHDLSALQTTKLRGGLMPIGPMMKSVYAEMAERNQSGPGLLGLPTPWHAVNTLTRGLRPGVLYIIGARPSMGKSICAANLAAFTALRGDRSALFSVEMTASEVLNRSLAALAKVPYSWVEQPTDDTPDGDLYWSRVTPAFAALKAAPMLMDETPALRIDQLMARARRAHQQSPLEMIVIDHLHDLDHGTGDKVRHEIGRAVQGAKSLAKEMDIPVVLLAQLNRGVTGRSEKRPTLADLRESGEIEQKADVIFFLHREDYYDSASTKTHLQGVVELIPAKGRNLKIGETIHLKNSFDQMRLDDWEGALPQQEYSANVPNKYGFGRAR